MQDTTARPLQTATKASLAAVTDERTRLLILGSLPGEISLRQAQYYANPRNQFWRLIGSVIGCDLNGAAYADRIAALLAAGVGVWDVIASAERVGSLDTNIRNHQSNALDEFAATLPSLRAIAFNGGKASSIGRRQLGPEPGYTLVTLPSSSPAHAVPFERKHAEWRALGDFLRAEP